MTRARLRPLLWVLLLAPLLLDCVSSPAPGTVHVVKRGETVYRIARYYEVSVASIVRANRVRDVRDIQPGTRLHVPGARRTAPAHALPGPGVAPRPGAVAGVRGPSRPREAARARGLEFRWPLRGQLTSRYGRRWGRRHEGIDVASRQGTPVLAAEAGKVIYSGNGLGAYGNVVIVQHRGDYATVYAHNRRNRVRKGSRVAKGQVVAELGATGNATGPHLHFEIRHRDRAQDPLLLLP